MTVPVNAANFQGLLAVASDSFDPSILRQFRGTGTLDGLVVPSTFLRFVGISMTTRPGFRTARLPDRSGDRTDRILTSPSLPTFSNVAG